jgi:co-chaperonin GroES (HSP10)
MRIIKDIIKVAQNRKNIYADQKRRPLEFKVGDKVYLKVSLWKHML